MDFPINLIGSGIYFFFSPRYTCTFERMRRNALLASPRWRSQQAHRESSPKEERWLDSSAITARQVANAHASLLYGSRCTHCAHVLSRSTELVKQLANLHFTRKWLHRCGSRLVSRAVMVTTVCPSAGFYGMASYVHFSSGGCGTLVWHNCPVDGKGAQEK